MPTLIDLRRRIRSVRNSQQVTKAMKTVSTAKFRKAQRSLADSRPFWHAFPELMERLAYWAGSGGHPLLDVRDEKKVEVIVVTGDKGLAGAFNSNLLARAEAFIGEKAASAEVRLVPIGRKSVPYFKKQDYPIDMAFGDMTDKLTRADVRALAEFLMKQYAFQRTDAVYVVYNEFKSILAPVIATAKLLPLAPEPGRDEAALWIPNWEPGPERIASFILPLFVESQIHHVLHESQAAEQAARMMAMDNATKNAQELIDNLLLVLNKIRQAGITRELVEIMTAVHARKKTA
jgi:F-type H+-transporting ATPase subunit gamma